MKKLYKGLLRLDTYGEACDILYLSSIDNPLAEELEWVDEKFVSIRYWITEKEATKQQAQEDFALRLLGVAESDFGSRYSDYTLWTDEELKVGGHDLICELSDNAGKYLILEVEAIDVVEKALMFATSAHTGQVRKYTGEPYINHPIAVSKIMSDLGFGEEILASALLHDVVEDTPITIEQIRFEFGKDVADIVEGLTDISKPEDGNRAERKAIDRRHIANSNKSAQNIKLADLIDNIKTIAKYDNGFAKVYLPEKKLTIEALPYTNTKLRNMAIVSLNEALAGSE